MSPERMAQLVARWVRFYTRDLPAAVAERRSEEIDADLHDHVAHERAHGTSDRRIALSIAARMARGMAADASWRLSRLAPREEATRRPARPAVLRVALVTAVILLVPFAAMQLTDEVRWSAGDFVFAGALLIGTGVLLELATRRARGAALAVGLAAIALGEGDDAPGLVLFGLLLIAGTVALTVRTAWRGG